MPVSAWGFSISAIDPIKALRLPAFDEQQACRDAGQAQDAVQTVDA